MRLPFLQLGDTVREDEINALIHLLITRDYPLYEIIQLKPDGFTGKLGTYTLQPLNNNLLEESIAYRGDDIEILNTNKDFKLQCNSKLKATFTLEIPCITEENTIEILNFVSNNNGEIIISPSSITNNTNNLKWDNNFKINVTYNGPYINPVYGEDNIINYTSELQQAINTSNNDTILQLTDTTIIHDIISHINVNNNLTIKGPATVKNLNPDNHTRLIEVDNNATLTFENITFEGFSDVNGGCIYNNGKLSIKNCKFKNCQAIPETGIDDTGYGGAIYNNYGEVYSTQNTYTNCEAVNGAGIYNKGDE